MQRQSLCLKEVLTGPDPNWLRIKGTEDDFLTGMGHTFCHEVLSNIEQRGRAVCPILSL
jgi:hypothetical protein